MPRMSAVGSLPRARHGLPIDRELHHADAGHGQTVGEAGRLHARQRGDALQRLLAEVGDGSFFE